MKHWDTLTGLLLCALALLLPVFPDEKLVRLKMQLLETGVFFLVFTVALRALLTNQWPSYRKDGWIAIAIGVWGVMNMGLWFLSSEKALATPELRRIFLAIGAFVIFWMGHISESWRYRFLHCWILSATVLSFYGILQITGGLGPLQVPQAVRAMGTFGNPIFFASYLLVSLFLLIGTLTLTKKESVRIWLFLAFVVQVMALYFTRTRAAWIAFGFCLLIRLGVYYRLKIPAKVWGLILLGLFFFGIKTQDVWKRDQGHLMIWRDTISMWKDHPVTGVGLGAFHVNFPDYAKADLKAKWPRQDFIVNYAHNEYIQMLGEGGILLFLSFGGILFFFVRAFQRARDPSDQSKHDKFHLWIFLGVVALLIQNFFSVDMRFGISFAILFLVMGLLLDSMNRGVKGADRWLTMPFSKLERGVMGLFWGVFMFVLVFPLILKPYIAHRTFSKRVDFFDARLLDPAKNIKDLTELLNKYPNEPKVLEKLAYVYAKEIKSVNKSINRDMANKAINTYIKLIEVDPANTGAANNLANIHYTLGNVDQALGAWEKTVEMKPDFIDVRLNLGKIYYSRGELKKAAHHFEEVQKLDPDNAEAIIYMKRMVE